MEALDETRRDDADHALVPVLAPDDEPATLPPLLGPALDHTRRLAQDPVLDRLPLAVQLFQPAGKLRSFRGVLGEDQLERNVGPTEATRGVDPRRETEADLPRLHGRRVDMCS